MLAPAEVIAAVISATGCADGGPSTRMVIAYPGLLVAIRRLRRDGLRRLLNQELCNLFH